MRSEPVEKRGLDNRKTFDIEQEELRVELILILILYV